jgi:MerR family transcriptional regulator, repressor of the yfmOP operon
MTAAAAPAASLRIGEVARRVGTTPRTIRYYEELGLLPGGEGRASGAHRLYDERDVDRLRDALRLKDLLGVSLDELRELLEAEEARALLREEWHHGEPDEGRRREILEQLRTHLDLQLGLVVRRRDEIASLEHDLRERRARVEAKLSEMR